MDVDTDDASRASGLVSRRKKRLRREGDAAPDSNKTLRLVGGDRDLAEDEVDAEEEVNDEEDEVNEEEEEVDDVEDDENGEQGDDNAEEGDDDHAVLVAKAEFAAKAAAASEAQLALVQSQASRGKSKRKAGTTASTTATGRGKSSGSAEAVARAHVLMTGEGIRVGERPRGLQPIVPAAALRMIASGGRESKAPQASRKKAEAAQAQAAKRQRAEAHVGSREGALTETPPEMHEVTERLARDGGEATEQAGRAARAEASQAHKASRAAAAEATATEGDAPDDAPDDEHPLTVLAKLADRPDGYDRTVPTSTLLAAKAFFVTSWMDPSEEEDPILEAAICLGTDVAEKYVARTLTVHDIHQAFLRAMLICMRLEFALREKNIIVSGTLMYDAGKNHVADFANARLAIKGCYMIVIGWREHRDLRYRSQSAAAPMSIAPSAVLRAANRGGAGGEGGGRGADPTHRDFNRLTYHVLEQAMRCGYRRHHGMCWKQIMSPPIRDVTRPRDEHRSWPTHAWRFAVDISQFLREATAKELFPEMYAIANIGNTLLMLEARLRASVDPEFAALVFNRHVHAFRNGLFIRDLQRFYEYSDPSLPSDLTAVKYNDVDFNMGALDVFFPQIPTPYFDRILNTQLARRPPFEQAWTRMMFYALFGRLGWPAGSDDWQVVLILLGLGGTGKSKMIDVAQMQYEPSCIGTISSHAQEQFGLETIYDKLLAVMPEAGAGKEGISQYDIQSMVSAENVSIGRKNDKEKTVRWDVPLLIVGNVLPRWMDNGGAMVRRGAMFLFDIPVPTSQQDMTLDAKLRHEWPAILVKTSAAYLSLRARFGHVSLWSSYRRIRDGKEVPIAPPMMLEGRMRMRELTHWLVRFLTKSNLVSLASTDASSKLGLRNMTAAVSDEVHDHTKLQFSMPLERFKELATSYMKESEGAKGPPSWKSTDHILLDFGIQKGALTADTAKVIEPGSDGTVCTYQPTGQQFKVAHHMWLWGVAEPRDEATAAAADADM